VSDEATVEVAKMVLVEGHRTSVLRLNRHGQPAVGSARRRLAAARAPPDGAVGRRTSASSARSEKVDVDVLCTSRKTTSR